MSAQAYRIGARTHPKWSIACKYLRDNMKSGDIIVASVPLAADYYSGSVNYRLNNGAFHNIVNGKTYRDPSTNVIAITSLDSLKNIISENKRGWLVLDVNKWQNVNDIPSDVSAYISNNLLKHNIEGLDTVHIFSWKN
jgi:hypothetical protein